MFKFVCGAFIFEIEVSISIEKSHILCRIHIMKKSSNIGQYLWISVKSSHFRCFEQTRNFVCVQQDCNKEAIHREICSDNLISKLSLFL